MANKKYSVTVQTIIKGVVEVEASNEWEAFELATEEFVSTMRDDYEYDTTVEKCEEVK